MVEALPIPDQELIQAVIAKDEDAFAELYARYHLLVRKVVKRMAAEDDIEDLVQGVFLKVYERIHQFNNSCQFGTWLYRIASNHVISVFRKKAIREGNKCISTDTVWDGASGRWLNGMDVGSEDESLQSIGDGEILYRMIDRLPGSKKSVIRKSLEGMSLKDIAIEEGRNASSVRTEYVRAVRQLRRWMVT